MTNTGDSKNLNDTHIPVKKPKKYIVECFGYGEINIKLVEEKNICKQIKLK